MHVQPGQVAWRRHDDQADAVGRLSDEEVETLIAVKGKLDGTDEVAGHARAADDTVGGFVW